MKNINFGYLFKHWIFTLIIGPIISQIVAFLPLFYPIQPFGLLEMFPIVFIASFIFSVPTYIVYALVYYYFSTKDLSILYSKTILTVIAVVGVFITTAFIVGILWNLIAVSYSISSIITGLIFNLDFKHEEES